MTREEYWKQSKALKKSETSNESKELRTLSLCETK